MQNTVLMLIDLQNDYFVGGKFPLPNINIVVEQSKKILEAVRKKSLPIIHVKHEFTLPDAPFFVQNSEGVKIHEIVKPLNNEYVVVKNYPNAFKETNIKEILDKHHCENIIVVGAMAQMCIDASVRAGADFGYNMTIIYDAVASQQAQFNNINVSAQEVHATFMNALSMGYANIIDTQEVISQLNNV